MELLTKTRRTPTRSDSGRRRGAGPRPIRRPIAHLDRSIGNLAVLGRIHSPYDRAKSNFGLPGDEFEPGVDPLEEDVEGTLEESAPSQNAPKCDACENGQGYCPKCASAGISSDAVERRTPGSRSVRYPIAHLDRSLGNQAVLRLIDSPCLPAGSSAAPRVPLQGSTRTTTPSQDAPSALKAPARRRGYTYTFISRGSYGQTSPGFTRPSCRAGARGTATLVAGSAAPTITVYRRGTYQVRRNDRVLKTATCTRLAAGLRATRAHENSHAAGARRGVASANTAQGLPRNFATAAACAAALPGILTPWNATVNRVWANEVAHGPGTNPPTAQTFTQENAAGTCTFT